VSGPDRRRRDRASEAAARAAPVSGRDRILVHRIAVFAYHGALPEEERLGQRFYVSLECSLDLSEAGRTDDLHATVCYGRLTEVVTAVATGQRFRIIEGLAEAIAGEILARFPPVEEVLVRVDKPSAPVPAIIDGVAVEIRRRRDGSS
jgi:7,8-dihydroneopterin aldolase/epimerase/oxygenase